MMYLHENVFGDIQMFINKFSSTMNQSNAKRNYSTVSDAQRPDTHTPSMTQHAVSLIK